MRQVLVPEAVSDYSAAQFLVRCRAASCMRLHSGDTLFELRDCFLACCLSFCDKRLSC